MACSDFKESAHKSFFHSRVSDLIGISESELVKIKNTAESEELINRRGRFFFRLEGEKMLKYPYGTFNTPTLAVLEALIRDLPALNTKCTFEIRENIDVGNLRTERNSMVQVASNFNCLEFPARDYLNNGYLVEKAHLDSTQGPAACFGPLAAYLYRAHFIPPVNLLDQVTEYLDTPIGGKITLTGKEKEITEDIIPRIKIGLHTEVEVLYNRQGKLEEPFIVDQCFNSTINLNDYGVKTKHTTKIVRVLLQAAYESVFMAALHRKRKYLYLTLIGGGCFHNPLDIICEELSKAYLKWTRDPRNTLNKVFLCLYDHDKSINRRLTHLI